MSDRIAVIVGVNPDDGQSYDMVMLDTGARLVGIKQVSQNATARSGSTDLLDIPDRGDAKWDVQKLKPEDCVRAVVGTANGCYYINGFLPPEVNQMTFKDPKLKVERHTSDVVKTIDGDGNVELYHPSGAYIRIGETPDHVDLTGTNADGTLKLDRNTGRKVHLRVALAGNVAVLTMTPTGMVTLELEQDFNLAAKGSINMKAAGDINMEAGGAITAKASSQIVTDAPEVVNPAGDIIATGVSLVGHQHSEVMPGPGESGPPVAS